MGEDPAAVQGSLLEAAVLVDQLMFRMSPPPPEQESSGGPQRAWEELHLEVL